MVLRFAQLRWPAGAICTLPGSIQPRPGPLAAQGHAELELEQSGLAFRWE